MDSTVIVALPAVDEKVNRISSEQIPHLTLLYLGPSDQISADDTIEIVQFVEHAASQLSPFSMSVDHRGTLGEDEADVLFFEKNDWSESRIASFRSHLLKFNPVMAAYQSVPQFPEWNPHLTLGYPATPAREDASDRPGIGYVLFDRIAVWTGNFDGPEFRLKYDDYPAVAEGMWSDMGTEDKDTEDKGAAFIADLFHYGVKGMRWGHRKSESSGGDGGDSGGGERGAVRRAITRSAVNTKTINREVAKIESKVLFMPKDKREEVAAAAGVRAYGKARELNKSPQFKGKDLKRDPELKKEYVKQLEAQIAKVYKDELRAAQVQMASEIINGVAARMAGDGSQATVRTPPGTTLRHDDEGDVLAVFNFELDDLDQVRAVTVDDLKHYGVKGMKWGVRNVDRASDFTKTSEKKARLTPGAKDVTVTQKKAGTYVQAKGGTRQKAADDAVKAAAGRQKAKASTTDALSNKELQDTIQRMELEVKFKQLNAKVDRQNKVGLGKRMANSLFRNERVRQAVVNNAGKVVNKATGA